MNKTSGITKKSITTEMDQKAYDSISKDRRLTNTSKYILPLLVNNEKSEVFNNGQSLTDGNISKSDFINAFFYNSNRNEERKVMKDIYILFDFNSHSSYVKAEEVLRHNNLRTRRVYYKKEYTLFIVETPLKFVRDLEVISKGLYTEMSRVAKEKIIRFWDNDLDIADVVNGSIKNQHIKSERGFIHGNGQIDIFNEYEETMPEEIPPEPAKIQIKHGSDRN